MKKNFLLLAVAFFLATASYAQMSFNGNKLKKSSFNLSNETSALFQDNNSSTKVFASDEADDEMKKRRRRGGKRRGGGGDYSNSIKTNPLSMIFGTFGVTYERKIADNMAVGLSVGLYARSTGVVGMEYNYSGFTLSPEFRYYFDEAIEGWYATAFITYTSITQKYTFKDFIDDGTGNMIETDAEISSTISLFGGGAAAGRQWIWGGFTLDVYAGISYLTLSGDQAAGGLTLSGVFPALGTAIGYSF